MKLLKKYWDVLALLIIIFVVFSIAHGTAPTYTAPPTYVPNRFSIQVNSVTVDDTPYATGTVYWDNMSSFKSIDESWEYIQLAFYGYGDGVGDGNSVAGTFSFTVWAGMHYSGAKLVYEGSGTCNGGEMSCNPVTGTQYNSGSLDPNNSYRWAGDIDAAGVGDVWESDIKDPNDSSLMATLVIETHGYPYWYVQIDDMTGSSVTSVTCVMGKYE
jgi:hypothetical protein